MLDLTALDRMEPATGGAATSVWRVDVRDRRFALRVFRAHERHVLDRELAAMSCARAGGVSAPRVFAIGTHDQRPALLTEWCHGEPLLQVLQHRPIDASRLGRAFGRMQRSVHALAAPPDLRADWIDWPAAADTALAARLRALSGRGQLLHLDYHPLNVLVQGSKPTALLDWTNAHAGDPRADLARTLTILRLMPRVLKQPTSIRAGSLVFEIGWRLGYGSFGPDLAPFYTWAGGAMLHDLAARVTPSDLEPVRLWTRAWRRRSHLPFV